MYTMNFQHIYLKSGFDVSAEITSDGKEYIAPKTHGCLNMGYWCWKNAFENPLMAIRFLVKKSRRALR